jgi:hypothetical protein
MINSEEYFADVIGKVFNKLKVIGTKKVLKYECQKTPRTILICECVCGNITEQTFYNLKVGNAKSCGCGRIVEDAGLKFILSKIQKDTRKIFCDLTLDDLKIKWNEQNGLCIYSGKELVLPIHSKKPNPDVFYKMASVDRIDSKKPYTKDNIQFVSRSLNLAKNNMSHQKMLEFMEWLKPKKELTFSVNSFLNGGGEGS